MKVANTPENESRQSVETPSDEVKNKIPGFELVRRYVRQKPARGLLLALAIGIVVGSLRRN